ncbi:hypothetical protein DID80_08095 [Candidatus Marinamargulisbacteria bacterium SCGC AAA071-K20]|nr:hypothetical protein DID80_08095 [Candidatus Marinamargulisbacteria bacterium SCGC AAA071-K20]
MFKTGSVYNNFMLINTVLQSLQSFHNSKRGIHLIDYILLGFSAAVIAVIAITFLANKYA